MSSDDPGFFGQDGVTFDYLVTYIAWDLNIRDIKKFVLNGIRYSTLSIENKKYLENEVFPGEWMQFIKQLIAEQ